MLFEMNNPKPVPISDFEANFVNSLGNTSGCIPVPVSRILKRISRLLYFFPTARVILPSFVNLIALLSRFEIT
jgi:hypothetical protein